MTYLPLPSKYPRMSEIVAALKSSRSVIDAAGKLGIQSWVIDHYVVRQFGSENVRSLLLFGGRESWSSKSRMGKNVASRWHTDYDEDIHSGTFMPDPFRTNYNDIWMTTWSDYVDENLLPVSHLLQDERWCGEDWLSQVEDMPGEAVVDIRTSIDWSDALDAPLPEEMLAPCASAPPPVKEPDDEGKAFLDEIDARREAYEERCGKCFVWKDDAAKRKEAAKVTVLEDSNGAKFYYVGEFKERVDIWPPPEVAPRQIPNDEIDGWEFQA